VHSLDNALHLQFVAEALMSDNGLITIASSHPFSDTVSRLEAALAAKGLAVFARVDHAAGAQTVGMALRPTVVFMFGNPKAGTPLMQSDQRVGIDLPLRVLAWEDAGGTVQLTCNAPAWIAARHGLGGAAQGAVDAMTAVLDDVARKATSRD
jgi:uncharacterized protein (DUF302 family)